MKTALLTIALLLGSSSLQAMPIYTFFTDDLGADLLNQSPQGGANSRGGKVTQVEARFDSGNQLFDWNYTTGPGKNSAINDGFWLVVSDGPDPKGAQQNEYAILFGDLNAGSVVAYQYNGKNNAGSYSKPGVQIDSFENAIGVNTDPSSGDQHVSVSIDTSKINAFVPENVSGNPDSSEWDGVSFSSSLGIWFHPTAFSDLNRNSTFTYDNNQSPGSINFGRGEREISSFNPQYTGYYDTNGSSFTATVPEPTSLALLGIGALVFGFSGRWN